MSEITVPLNDAWIQHTAAGGETSFAYDFPIFDEAHLVVELDGVVQTLTTNYTVNGVGEQTGGTITLVSPASATAAQVWTLYRDVPEARTTDFQTRGDFNAVTVNRELDLLTMMIQQLRNDFDRTIRQLPGDAAGTMTLPLKASRLSKFLGFDSSGNVIAAAGTSASLGPVSAFVDTLLDDADAATFLATLGLSTISQAEAEAGIATTDRLWTAQRVQQAIAALASSGIGTQETPIMAGAMTPRTTNGSAAGLVELATNDVMLRSQDFDQTTVEACQFMLPLPKRWNAGTVTFRPYWTAASGSGGVTWGLRMQSWANDDPLDAAWGTRVDVDDTLLLANDLHVGPESAAITIANTPAKTDMIVGEISRETGDVADTLTADAKLLGIVLRWTSDAGTDA